MRYLLVATIVLLSACESKGPEKAYKTWSQYSAEIPNYASIIHKNDKTGSCRVLLSRTRNTVDGKELNPWQIEAFDEDGDGQIDLIFIQKKEGDEQIGHFFNGDGTITRMFYDARGNIQRGLIQQNSSDADNFEPKQTEVAYALAMAHLALARGQGNRSRNNAPKSKPKG